MLPAGNQQVASSVYCTTSRKHPSAPEDGRNYCPKLVELIEIINKIIIVASRCCLYYCINDARSHKHQMWRDGFGADVSRNVSAGSVVKKGTTYVM